MVIGKPDPDALEAEGSGYDLEAADAPGRASDPVRFRLLFDQHHAFVGRLLRRLGVSESGVDDLLQNAFIVLARKLESIHPGSERAFLYGTAQRLVIDFRRLASQRYELPEASRGERQDPTPAADELLDQKRARQMLDQILDAMTPDLRSVFVLFELERLTMSEIAELLGVAPGTVASRLRRAREDFLSRVAAAQAALAQPAAMEEVAS